MKGRYFRAKCAYKFRMGRSFDPTPPTVATYAVQSPIMHFLSRGSRLPHRPSDGPPPHTSAAKY